MKCSCGTTNLQSAIFCKGCGIAVEVNLQKPSTFENCCDHCKAPLIGGSKFCTKCGFKNIDKKPVLSGAEDHQAVVNSNLTKCQFCDEDIKLGAKFCNSCGKSTNTVEKVASVTAPIITPQSKPNFKDAVNQSSDQSFKGEVGGEKSHANKKLIMAITASFAIVAVVGLSWFGYNKFTKSTTAAALTEASTEGVNSSLPSSTIPNPAATVAAITVPQDLTPVNESLALSELKQSSPSKYSGRVIKNGGNLDIYMVEMIGKTGNYKVFSANQIDDVGILMFTKVVLSTDSTGRVLDSKESISGEAILVESKSACVKNNKPYLGAYALSTVKDKLTLPIAIWILSESGQLIPQAIDGIQCGVYLKFMDESDVVESVTGHNDLQKSKPSVQKQSKVSTSSKKVQPQQNSLATKQNPTIIDSKPTTPPIQQQEAKPSQQEAKPAQQEEIIVTNESKDSQLNTLGGLFKKLEESIKKGEQNPVCTSSQRAMNQCQ